MDTIVMRNKVDLKSQFKVLAQLMATIEETVILHDGLSLEALDRIGARHSLSKQGEEVLLSMLVQSDKVAFNEEHTMLIVKQRVVDV